MQFRWRLLFVPALVLAMFTANLWSWRLTFGGNDLRRTQIFFGVFGAEVLFVAVLSVISRGNVVIRISTSILLLTLLWCAIAWSPGWDASDPPSSRAAMYFGIELFLQAQCVLTTFIVLRIPFWLIANRVGWRLHVERMDDRFDAKRYHFQLRDLLWATLCASASLASLRDAFLRIAVALRQSEEETILIFPGAANALDWLSTTMSAMNVPIHGVIFAVVSIPALVCLFAAFVRKPLAAVLLVSWTPYSAVLAIFWSVLIASFNPSIPPTGEFEACFFINLGLCYTLFFSGLTLRAAGFRLIREPR
ncbi:MAG: hypothetical protein KDA42_04990 [Planctomycetales bacterium]|nr:hypothetical protein [Planctomycetales bacterium]